MFAQSNHMKPFTEVATKLEPGIWSRDTGHISIHGWVDAQTDGRMMTSKFFASITQRYRGYHVFLTMVLRARRAPL